MPDKIMDELKIMANKNECTVKEIVKHPLSNNAKV